MPEILARARKKPDFDGEFKAVRQAHCGAFPIRRKFDKVIGPPQRRSIPMDALELLKTRKSISAPFLAEPGPIAAQLDEMLTIASRVPDHGKLAPWRFIVIVRRCQSRGQRGAGRALCRAASRRGAETDRGRAEEARPRAAGRAGGQQGGAASRRFPEFEQLLSAANAALNLELAAHALGFAAQWTTGWIAYDPAAARILGLTPAERLVAVIHIGTPTVPLTDRPRPALDAIVSWWQAPE